MIFGIFGGGSGPSETTSTTLPDWVKDRYQDIWGREDELYELAKGVSGGMDPREILGVSDIEKQGLMETLKGFTMGEGFLNEAGDFSGVDSALGGMGGVLGEYGDLGGRGKQLEDYSSDRVGDKTLDEARESYESQYTDDVVDSTLANADRKREAERLKEQLATTAAGGTSNTRGAIAGAVGDQLYGMNRAQLEAEMRDRAFERAANLGQSETQMGMDQDQMNYDFLKGGLDFGRSILGDQQGVLESILSGEQNRQGTMQELSDMWGRLGSAKGAALGGFGELQRMLEQGQMDADRTHGMDQVNWLSSILGQGKSGGMPDGVGERTSSSDPGSPSFGQTLLGLGGLFMSSDARAKEDIEPMGDGALEAITDLTPTEYRYKEGEPGHRPDRHAGLIAQDIERRIPSAVIDAPDGRKRVDPWPITATIIKAVSELNAKVDGLKGAA